MSNEKIHTNNWMSKLADEMHISDIAIPGTHDTCALQGGDLFECQSEHLIDQLNAGIRFIDIRCRHIENVFAIHHSISYQGINFGEGVRDVCLKFLKNNPGECIIMLIKPESDEKDCTRSFEETFNWYLHNNTQAWYLDNKIPKLGEARGKIILIRRFSSKADNLGINALGWKDNSTFYLDNKKIKIQDEYVVNTILDISISKKWDSIHGLLKDANEDKSNCWYINFVSGSSSGAYPNAVANRENSNLDNYLDDHKLRKTGTVVMDFPKKDLIKDLIGRNFYDA